MCDIVQAFGETKRYLGKLYDCLTICDPVWREGYWYVVVHCGGRYVGLIVIDAITGRIIKDLSWDISEMEECI